jgi:NAD(P)-dependent dehydrogenase (short-subunit alcohol dehydrogenase family)
LYQEKVPAGIVVANGFGKFAGSTQVEEVGEVETPILLTNTLSVPEAMAASIEWTLAQAGDAEVRTVNPVSAKLTTADAMTVAFAKELAPLGFKVNAGCPGYTATDLNQHTGSRPPEQGAAIGIRLAILADDGPTGGFFDDEGRIAW